MHERSLVRALLTQVRELQLANGAARVLAVKVSIGDFAGVDAELFRSAFDELSVVSAIGNAKLELERVPLEVRCPSCVCVFVARGFQFKCPTCGDSRVEIIRGEGLVLESVVLD